MASFESSSAKSSAVPVCEPNRIFIGGPVTAFFYSTIARIRVSSEVTSGARVGVRLKEQEQEVHVRACDAPRAHKPAENFRVSREQHER